MSLSLNATCVWRSQTQPSRARAAMPGTHRGNPGNARPSLPRERHRPALLAPPAGAGPRAGIVSSLLAALLVAVFLARIAAQAARAYFNTDECFHAHASQWIAAHHRLPEIMPELYSGFYYYYPPLLHLLGAMWIA